MFKFSTIKQIYNIGMWYKIDVWCDAFEEQNDRIPTYHEFMGSFLRTLWKEPFLKDDLFRPAPNYSWWRK